MAAARGTAPAAVLDLRGTGTPKPRGAFAGSTAGMEQGGSRRVPLRAGMRSPVLPRSSFPQRGEAEE